MNLVAEYTHGSFRMRVTDCGCGWDTCDKRYLFATTHDVLWLAVGVIAPAAQEEIVGTFIRPDGLDGDAVDEVARGVGLVGLTWPMLTASRQMADRQMLAYSGLPHWLADVSSRAIWACRAWVFGEDDLHRVPRALGVLAEAYVPEGPVLKAELP